MTRQGPRDSSRQPARGGKGGAAALVRGVGIRLERQESQKTPLVTGSSMPPTIIVVDDDDDIHISSPRSFAQARSAVSSSRQRSRAAAESGENRVSSTEDLLELRLGPTNYTQSASLRTTRGPGRPADNNKPHERSGQFTIDLTAVPVIDNDCILVNEFVQKKRKPAQPAYEAPPPEPAKELKLTCAICMDSMKEETSTICGHIFCRKCIMGAIAVQKKCPTCRQTLTTKQTHRIYISASLKNS